MKIYIEANIGAGKSTFIHLLKNKLKHNNKYSFVLEPVEVWKHKYKNKENNNILDLFYNNVSRWSYTFQMTAFMTRIQSIQQKIEENPNNIFFIERSIYTDKNCFAKLCYQNNLMDKIEWELYNDCFLWLEKTIDVKPDIYLYLYLKPEKCLERIKKRNREEEINITLEYLTQLHNKHEIWMEENIKKGVNVIKINVEEDFEENEFIFLNHCNKILNYISTHTKNNMFDISINKNIN